MDVNSLNNPTISEMVEKMGVAIKKYQNPEPYPEVKVGYEDSRWLPLIFDDYSSRISEFTAVSQYIFGHFTSDVLSDKDPKYKKIADTFQGISIIEMFHLELHAETIAKIGEQPIFVNHQGKSWKSKFVPYGSSPIQNLKLAIKAEEDAIQQYENHIKIIQNQSIKQLLARIVIDEKLHLKIFNELLAEFSNK